MATPDALAHFTDGLTYDAFVAGWRDHVAAPREGLDKHARKYRFYAQYNMERTERMQAAYTMSEELQAAVDAIVAPQRWVVLTEDWCVDSAFVLPVFVAAAERSPHVQLRIFRRDEHLDLMDQYLTSGGRSIPKVVAFGPEGNELFQWGPRPQAVQHLRDHLKAEGATGRELSQAVLDAYDEGQWMQADVELAALLTAVTAPAEAKS